MLNSQIEAGSNDLENVNAKEVELQPNNGDTLSQAGGAQEMMNSLDEERSSPSVVTE